MDESGGDRDVRGICYPDLVRAIYNLVACEVWEDGTLVIAVGRCHRPSGALGLQARARASGDGPS